MPQQRVRVYSLSIPPSHLLALLSDRMQGADIGAIASSLSPAMGSLQEGLERIRSSASLEHKSYSGLPLILQAGLAFSRSRELWLRFLRRCVDYGEIVTCTPLVACPTSTRVGALHDLRDRAMRPRFETTSVSAESGALTQGLFSYQLTPLMVLTNTHGNHCSPGSRMFRTRYKQALSLEQKAISGLNTLQESLSSWAAGTDGLSNDASTGVVTLQQLHELSYAWAKARDSVRAALATLTSEPARRLYYRSASLALPRPRSAMRRWVMRLVCLS